MNRILVIGSGGAGKSTFARALGELLDLPVIHLDRLYWKAGWEKPSKAEWARIVDRETGKARWIMDGNYGGTLPQRLKRCDAVILLDIPRWTCLWRVAKRLVKYRGRHRPEMAPGCHERFDWEFIRWIWNYPEKSRPAKLALLSATSADQRVVILGSTGEVRRFLDETRREVGLRKLSAALAAES
jgi:adenylate kinase family enzyme